MVQNGKQIYYAKEVGSTPAYIIKKLKIYRYTMTTGKNQSFVKNRDGVRHKGQPAH